jgi:hypothetical protein
MADTKLSALTELAASPATDDEIYIRDISEAAVDESKRITVVNLVNAAAITAVEGEATLTLAGDVTIDGAKSLSVDVINEKDAAAGVTIDSVLLKDGLVDGIDVAARDHAKYLDSEAIAAVEGELTLVLAGDVTIDGAKSLSVDVINEKDAAAGVTIDGVLLKDSAIAGGAVPATHSGTAHHTKYTDAEAVTAVEAELTLVLAGDVTIDGAKTLKVDVIDEKDAAAGVTIDSVLLKDGLVDGIDVAARDHARSHDHSVSGDGQTLQPLNLDLTAATELTIATGDITVTQNFHKVDTQTDASTDDLVGIIGGSAGRILVIRPESAARTVVVKHNGSAAASDNIFLADGLDFTMDEIRDCLTLIYDATLDTNGAWLELARSAHHIKYTNAEAITAVEGEATLVLAGDVTIDGAKTLKVDVIDEKDAAAGVTIDGVLLKDSAIAGGAVPATHSGTAHHTKFTSAEAITAVEGELTLVLAGDVTIDGAKTLSVDVINEKDAAAGVTIDSVVLKDGLVDGIDVAARDHAQSHNHSVAGDGQTLQPLNLDMTAATELTIATGDITVTQNYHTVDTEADASTDPLVGIIGGSAGRILVIRPESTARSVVVTHNGSAAASDNILLADAVDFTMDEIRDTLTLIYDATLDTNGAWIEISRSSSSTGYTDANAISAVEGELTLVLAGDVTIDGAKTLAVDVINEKDAAAGVTIDSVLLKDGLVDGVDVAARDHAASHTVASHSDTTGTGAELNTLTDGSETTLHTHAGGGGAVAREGGNTTEATSTSTSVVDLLTMASLTVAVTEPFDLIVNSRKDAGASANVGFGLKINATIVGTAATTTGVEGFGSSSSTRQIETLLLTGRFGARVTGFFQMADGNPGQWQNAGVTATTRQANKVQTANFPNATITDVIINAITNNASITMFLDEGHVYSYDDGV